MTTVGIVGWRGMVGSVLLERMRAEKDFQHFDPIFFSTSQAGKTGPLVGKGAHPLRDANDIEQLKEMDMIVSCQGGDYTTSVHGSLRKTGWSGFWIDAASSLRMSESATIILDPVNHKNIDAALKRGTKDFIGGNCTVSLMLMAIGALFEKGWVEWVNSSTYQAASGAGARNMRELVHQMAKIGEVPAATDPKTSALLLDQQVIDAMRSKSFPISEFGVPLAGSLIPWIDSGVSDGQTREEWKGHVETNKILGLSPEIPVDGTCVRIGAMRCHAQALTIKLKKNVPLKDIEDALSNGNEWAKFIPNNKEATVAELSPAACSGTLSVPVGRVRKMRMGDEYLQVYTVGDQLLWGAAEPLRRMVLIALGVA